MKEHIETTVDKQPVWSWVYALSFNMACLGFSEFLPTSLLTGVAEDFKIPVGAAQQCITFTSLTAFATSLFITYFTRSMDRQFVLLSFTFMVIGSNALAFFATSIATFLISRMILGIALGGITVLSVAVLGRAFPARLISKALLILLSGFSTAALAATFVGGFLGETVGWRLCFLVTSFLGSLSLIWQWSSSRSDVPLVSYQLPNLIRLLRGRHVGVAMVPVVLVLTGNFKFLSNLIPLFNRMPRVGIFGFTPTLITFSVAVISGLFLCRFLFHTRFYILLFLMPLLMSLCAFALAIFTASAWITSVIIVLWGLVLGPISIGWCKWFNHNDTKLSSSATLLILVGIQLAVTIGTLTGIITFDSYEMTWTLALNGLIYFSVPLFIWLGLSAKPLLSSPIRSS